MHHLMFECVVVVEFQVSDDASEAQRKVLSGVSILELELLKLVTMNFLLCLPHTLAPPCLDCLAINFSAGNGCQNSHHLY